MSAYFGITDAVGPIWGIGCTADEAWADARELLSQDYHAQGDDYDDEKPFDVMRCYRITEALYEQVSPGGDCCGYELSDGRPGTEADRAAQEVR